MLSDFLNSKNLSDREIDVVNLMVKGHTNREIGEKLFVSEKTIKFHNTNIFKKFGVLNRTKVMAECIPYLVD